MIQAKAGDHVRIRDDATGEILTARVLGATYELIVTTDPDHFITRFGPDGWNASRTRRLLTGPSR